MSSERNWYMLYLPRKSYPKGFDMWCTNMGRLSRPRHEISWNPQACDSPCCRLHLDIPNSMGQHLHALLSYYEVLLFEPRTKANIYFLFLEYILWSKIQRWWKHDSARLSSWVLTRPISTAVVDATKWLPITLAIMRTGCRLKSTVVWYFPFDTYEGRCSTDMFYQMSTKSKQGSKRIPAAYFVWPLL